MTKPLWALLGLCLAAAPLSGATVTVNDAGDASGACATTGTACPGTFTNWIEELAAESVTGGCGGGNYCPASPNTRGQMAVFLTKTFHLQ